MNKSTMVELIPELEKLYECEERDQLILEAKNGEFHDYKNKKYNCGKVSLTNIMSYWIEKYPQDCQLAEKIRKDIIDGAYDEEADEDDKEMMRQNLREDAETPEQAEKLIKMFGLQ